MIREILLENFKGFGRAQHIPLSKITLLLGPNSSGKSSVLHSLLLLKQTLEEAETPSTVLLPKGRSVDLGSYGEMIHDHKLDKEMRFGFRFFPAKGENPLRLQRMLSTELLRNPATAFDPTWLSLSVKMQGRRRAVLSKMSGGTGSWAEQIFSYAEDTSGEGRKARRERSALKLESLDREHPAIKSMWVEMESFIAEVRRRVPSDVADGTAVVEALRGLGHPQTGQQGRYFRTLRNSLLHISPNFVQAWRSALDGYGRDQFETDLWERNTSVPLVFDRFLPSTAFGHIDWVEGPKYTGIEVPDVSRLAVGLGRALAAELESIVHLGPLREHPERQYVFSGNAVNEVGRSGKLAPDLLYSEPRLVKEVNAWLGRFGVQHTLKVKRLGSPGISEIYALRLSDRNTKIDLGAPDVGFGMSQVLPVLAQSIFSAGKLLLIEQPELHLHPRLQAELGSFFASCAQAGAGNQFLIETHSEHLVLRLQALVRRGDLKPADVSVVFLENLDGETTATPIRIDERGRFLDQWPGGFFPERLEELK